MDRNSQKSLRNYLAILGLGFMISGCAVSQNATGPAQTSSQPAIAQPAGGVLYDRSGQAPPPIVLPETGEAAFTTVEPVIIDTRLFGNQIQGGFPWEGEVLSAKSFLPPHKGRGAPPAGDPNDLLVDGGVGTEIRTAGGPMFPGIAQTRWSPPDPTAAAGPNHIVETVNSTVAFYDKEGNLEFSAILDSTGNPGFFEDQGAGDFVVDPKIIYDHEAQRFVMTAIEVYFGSGTAWIDVAVSDDSDPHGIWYKYRTNARLSFGGSTLWVDYPGSGYDSQAYYVTGNLFPFSGAFSGALFRVLPKAPMLVGDPVTFADLWDPSSASAQPAHHFGTSSSPYFCSAATTSSIRVHSILDPLGSPTLVSADVAVPSYQPTTRFTVPTPEGSIDGLDSRLINVHWRDGRLYTAHAVSSGGKHVARWYEFRTGDWPASGSPTLFQSGNFDAGRNLHTFFPAIFSDRNHNVGLGVGTSNAQTFPGVEYTGRFESDPLGTMGPATEATRGDRGASGRWGDYFDIMIDPTDDATFWIVGEYQNSGGWATWVSSFSLRCPADFNGDGVRNILDFLAFLNAYNDGDPSADLNGDGVINTQDFTVFLNLYNEGCP